MSDNKVLNFIKLLEKHPVEIPIIQRDYVQGLDKHKSILDKFLLSLKDKIEKKLKISMNILWHKRKGADFS